MSDSPESVVREFLAVWEGAAKLDLLLSFFDDDAVWVDGPRGVHHGLDAIRSELEVQISMGFEVMKEDVKSLVAERGPSCWNGLNTYVSVVSPSPWRSCQRSKSTLTGRSRGGVTLTT